MRFLFKLAETTEASINRINRWLVCEGYPPTFYGAKLAAPFVSNALIAAEIAELNAHDAYPDLPRPVSLSDYQTHFPLAQPGLCYVNLNHHHPLSALAPLFNWANAHPALVTTWVLHKNQWLLTAPLDPLPTPTRLAISSYKTPFSPSLAFNQLLNYTQELVLPQPSILFLFHAHQILQSNGTIPNGTAQALSLLCQNHDCSYAISSDNQLLFGSSALIPCNPALYQKHSPTPPITLNPLN